MSKCTRCDKMHMLRSKYCEGCQPYVRIAELEAKLERLTTDSYKYNVAPAELLTDALAENKRLRQALELICERPYNAQVIAEDALQEGE